MSCENCLGTPKGLNEAFINIKKQALDYAKEKQTPVAIYKDGFDYYFTTATAAFAAGYIIIEIV